MTTRKQLLKTIVGLKMLSAGYPHIWVRMLPKKRRSWLWKADEFGLLLAESITPKLTDLYFKDAPLMARLRQAAWLSGDGGTSIACPIMYGKVAP